MIVNPDEFQPLILSCDKKDNRYTSNKNDSHITSEDSVILFDVEIDNKLKSIFQLFAEKQLNAISRIQHFIDKKEKKVTINSFAYSNFTYYSLLF